MTSKLMYTMIGILESVIKWCQKNDTANMRETEKGISKMQVVVQLNKL